MFGLSTNILMQKTYILNSHHDTVNPNQGYTMILFKPLKRVFGLGSNDAGGCLLLCPFLYP
jgi:acetylornithine deacetylase